MRRRQTTNLTARKLRCSRKAVHSILEHLTLTGIAATVTARSGADEAISCERRRSVRALLASDYSVAPPLAMTGGGMLPSWGFRPPCRWRFRRQLGKRNPGVNQMGTSTGPIRPLS